MPNPRTEYRDNRAQLAGEHGNEYVAKDELSRALESIGPATVEEDWQRVVGLMPLDLETSARQTKALQRRREVRTAADLLRLVLAYVLYDWSLQIVSAWACLKGHANLSGVALRKRLRATTVWMGCLVGAWVISNRHELAGYPIRLRLVDATTVSCPGSKGTDWRIHLSLDLGRMCIDGAEVSSVSGGETLVRHPVQPGDILVVDGGYSQRRGIGNSLAQGGELVLRINWQNLPLKDEEDCPVDLFQWLRQVLDGETAERRVIVETPHGDYSVRLIAQRLAQEAADRARKRLRRQASKKGHTIDQRSLEAAGFVILLTTLESEKWAAEQVLALYRLRWQVEMLFKRLKGVLSLDGLRAKDPALARTYILGKLLAAMIADRLGQSGPAECAAWFSSMQRPVSPWRWLVWWSEALSNAIRGAMTLATLWAGLTKLRRYFSDTPRRRRQQHALARCLGQLLAAPPISRRSQQPYQSLLQPTGP